MNRVFFTPTFGNRPLRILGREQIIAEFTQGLSSSPGHPYRASILLGQRGMGKTALLLEFAEIGERLGFAPVSIVSGDDMLDEIIETLQIEGGTVASKGKVPVKSVSAGAFGFSFGLAFTDKEEKKYSFRTKLTLLADALEKHDIGLLLLIDEVQAATPSMRTLATTYQHLVGRGKNIAIVMAGLPNAVSSVLNDKVLTFLNRAHPIELGTISFGDIRAYYAECFEKLKIRISVKDIESAVVATKGYPYLLQLIGFHLIEYAGKSEKITSETVQMAIRNSEEDLISAIYKPCLTPLSDRDLDFLKAMAIDEHDSVVVDIQERLGISQGTAQTYRKRLIDAGIIASGRRGRVEIIIPYLREYMTRIS